MVKGMKHRMAQTRLHCWTCVKFLYASVFLLSFMVNGCGAGPVWTRDDPRDVVNGFLQTAEVQNVEVMWEYLSTATQKSLNERADAFNAQSQNGSSRKGFEMLRTTGHVISSTREYKKLEVSSQTAEEAVVDIVMQDGSVKSLTLHRENGRWTIDLPLGTEK